MIPINNAAFSTWIFGVLFLFALLVSARKLKTKNGLTISVTTEIKGFAILAIIFSHIAYILVSDDKFLWPLSIMAGIGVNIFLFASGFGLSVSGINKNLSIKDFYLRKLTKLFIPFWIIVFSYLLIDYFFLSKTYSGVYIFQSFMGIFTTADIDISLNSPFWYFSVILMYYLLFPVVFIKKHLWVTALILYGFGYWLVHTDMLLQSDLKRLYQVHFVAFPMGVFFAWLLRTNNPLKVSAVRFIASISITKLTKKILYFSSILGLLAFIAYFGYHSGVDGTPLKEQTIGALVTLAVVALFSLKKIEFKLFYIFGILSFEIYLLHWPILSRYTFFYQNLPGWLATTLYLGLFLVLAYAVKYITTYIFSKIPIKY